MHAATQDILLQGILTGGVFLLVILIIWILVHHSKPGMRIDIGVRGWISLKPGESAEGLDEVPDERTSGDDSDNDVSTPKTGDSAQGAADAQAVAGPESAPRPPQPPGTA